MREALYTLQKTGVSTKDANQEKLASLADANLNKYYELFVNKVYRPNRSCTLFIHRGSTGRFSPKYILCQVPTQNKVAYLTFDDGPVPEATPEVLEILKEYKAKATFFCVGENVCKHKEIF